MYEVILELWTQHRGKIIGLLLGIGLALLILKYGFWKSLFIVICAAIGLFIGKRIDEQGNLRELYQRWFPERDR